MLKKKLSYKTLILFLGIVLILVVGFYLSFFRVDDKIEVNFDSRLDKINEFETEALKVGWIQVQGANIDLPVLDYIAYLDSNTNYKYAWAGNYFNDEMNRRVISGHNVLNVSSNPVNDTSNLEDFEGLMTFVYHSFAKENLYIQYTDYKTQEENLYKIYAVGFYDYNDGILMGFDNDESVDKYLKMVLENSIYDYSVDVNSSDELITLVTCTRFFGSNTKQQIFIDARKVREDEEITKYKVKKRDLFKEYNLFE